MSPSGSERQRVVVTGIGTVSSAGIGREAFWSSLVRTREATADHAIKSFDPGPWLKPNEVKRSDPYIVYAVAAAELALDDAGRPSTRGPGSGVVMGNLHGAMASIESQQKVHGSEGAKAVSPMLCVISCEDACASTLSIRFGCGGPSKLVVTACASGTAAVGEGAALIANGICDMVLAGATFGTLSDVLRASYENLRVVSPTGLVRPFDARRDGLALSEGAAVLVLESGDRASERGARPYGEVAGFALTNDAFHYSKPSGEGLERSMLGAMSQAGIDPTDVVHVNAHGTGTLTGDAEESAAIKRIFGSPGPSVTSIKGATGHSLAASGAFEAASVMLSFEHRVLPPTGIDMVIDPEIDIDIVMGAPRPWEPGPTLSNSFGLGGQNATAVFLPMSRG